jgi:hypothetical protein
MDVNMRNYPMSLKTCGRALPILALCVMACGGCARHRIATSFAELEKDVKPGQTVYLTSANGDVKKGKLERFTGTSADVNISGGTVRFLERDTLRIAVREPLWHGAVIGAASGLVLGSAGEQAADFYSFCPTAEGLGPCESGMPVRGMLIGAGLGAAIGAGIDALVWRRTRIFDSPQTEKSKSLVLSPLAGRRGVGLRLTARF